MAQKQFLTYPYGIKYKRDGWETQVKQVSGIDSSLPCKASIYEGRTVVVHGDTEWWGDGRGNTTYSFDSLNTHPFNQRLDGVNQKGLHYWVSNTKDKTAWARWFDIGTMGGAGDGATVPGDGSGSSWLREVTAVWFMFNSHDTTKDRGCYSQIEKCAIRYRDPNGRHRIKNVTEKLGDLGLKQLHRGDNKVMFGYALPSNQREDICKNNWRFIGLRVQIRLEKTAGVSQQDTIQGGISGIRLGLGPSPTGTYNETAKRALVGRGNVTWNGFNPNNMWLETR